MGNTDRELACDQNWDPKLIQRWGIVEIRIYDINFKNVSHNKPVTLLKGTSVGHAGTVPQNIVNGKIFNTDNAGNNVLADNGLNGYSVDKAGIKELSLLEIDLGLEYNIHHIVIFNRFHGAKEEGMNGTTIKLIGQGKDLRNVIHTGMWYQTYSKEYIL